MSVDVSYQVVRNYGGHAIGDVLASSDFVDIHRAAQLVDQRYLVPIASGSTQPTVGALLNATVRKVSDLVTQVADACVLETALVQEPREVARKAIMKRLEELSNGEQTH